MPKKINLVFEDDVFERLVELKGSKTYAKVVSDLVMRMSNHGILDEEDTGAVDDRSAEILEVSSEKLLSILNAINDRFALFTGYGERLENLERALEGLTEIADSIERTAFDNKENFDKLKNTFLAIQERIEGIDTPAMTSGGNSEAVSGFLQNGSITNSEVDFEQFEFACPNCDGTVDENDFFCRWCAMQLSDADQCNQSSGYYENYVEQNRTMNGTQYQNTGGSNFVRETEWNYDKIDRDKPPTGPPPGWNSSRVQLDSNGRPVCPECREAMLYVDDYGRWFCEICWYYAPRDFLQGNGKTSDKVPGKKLVQKERRIVDKRDVNKRKWNSKKIGELPLFRKKRDKR